MAKRWQFPIKPWQAGALILVIALVAAYFVMLARPSLAQSTETTIQTGANLSNAHEFECGALEGKDYDRQCWKEILLWKHCEGKVERAMSFDCSSLQESEKKSYCNPRGTLVDGSIGATCGYVAAGEATPIPTGGPLPPWEIAGHFVNTSPILNVTPTPTTAPPWGGPSPTVTGIPSPYAGARGIGPIFFDSSEVDRALEKEVGPIGKSLVWNTTAHAVILALLAAAAMLFVQRKR